MRVAIFTLGCKTNQYEGELIRESFERYGDKIVPFKETADLYIINSCVVTKKAEAETRKALHSAQRRNPSAKIILTSCFANLHTDFKSKNTLLYRGDRSKIADFFYKKTVSPIDLGIEQIKKFADHTRATVKIEEGCDNFCTYCIVPFVRGNKIRSKPIDIVTKEVRNLVNSGYKEIILTGTEIGKYGKDINVSLSMLLKSLKTIKGLERIRISSIYPTAVTDELISEIDYPVVPHLHMSIQSGDNRVLKKMKRNYTTEEYLGIVDKLRKKDKNFSISTDIIVGFPGEDEEAFLNSMTLVQKVEFSKVHIFRYSKRPFTPAFFMEETVSEGTKKIRSQRLSEMVNTVQKSYKERFISKNIEVLVEEEHEGFFFGFTPYYLRVKFKCSENITPGSIISVKVTKADSNLLYGECI
jgi:threonylcarbamoyladenosine tRNA methylthiotransferase MtaB